MKQFLFLSLFMLTTFCMISQTKTEVTAPKMDAVQKNYKTLVLDFSDKSLNTAGALKDELIAWKEKIVSISIDETAHRITIVHNQLIDERELFEVIEKYGLSRKFIVSYN
ncbi:MAG: hypothetical protein JST26_01570 [Bacteroidetes bacterium]|nr:hypothetical protein [Bacteroidota bacterium]